MDKLNEMKKQLETRWKQIDKFEAGVKSYGEAKAAWRRKFAAKEGEVDALKARSGRRSDFKKTHGCIFHRPAITNCNNKSLLSNVSGIHLTALKFGHYKPEPAMPNVGSITHKINYWQQKKRSRV